MDVVVVVCVSCMWLGMVGWFVLEWFCICFWIDVCCCVVVCSGLWWFVGLLWLLVVWCVDMM